MSKKAYSFIVLAILLHLPLRLFDGKDKNFFNNPKIFFLKKRELFFVLTEPVHNLDLIAVLYNSLFLVFVKRLKKFSVVIAARSSGLMFFNSASSANTNLV